MIAVHTERLQLRPLVASHADALFEGLHDRRLFAFVPGEPSASVEHLRERYTKLAARASPDGTSDWLNWALWCIPEDRYIGFVQATIPATRIPTIGYVLFYDAWGKGYAREATSAMIAHLASHYHTHEIHATVDTRNAASIKVLEGLGFEPIALRKEAEWVGGILSDEFDYRLIVKDPKKRA